MVLKFRFYLLSIASIYVKYCFSAPFVVSPGPCDQKLCKLPACFCSGVEVPLDMAPRDIPQMVFLTFDDSLNVLNFVDYDEILSNRYNPNGASISATFFISHENSDYYLIQKMHEKGHEIALHTITHQATGDLANVNNEDIWRHEILDQRLLMSHFAKIPIEGIKGFRAPFLQMGGNTMLKVLQEGGLEYDCSRPTEIRHLWPYTGDYDSIQDCGVEPCHNASFPGFWIVPTVNFISKSGNPASMVDGCVPMPDGPEETFQLLLSNFMDSYLGNRAPFAVPLHSSWLTHHGHKDGYKRFLDFLGTLSDVHIVSISKVLDWMRTPKQTDRVDEISSWRPSLNSTFSDICPRRYDCTYQGSAVPHGYETSFISCQPCPARYPWVNNPFGEDPLKSNGGSSLEILSNPEVLLTESGTPSTFEKLNLATTILWRPETKLQKHRANPTSLTEVENLKGKLSNSPIKPKVSHLKKKISTKRIKATTMPPIRKPQVPPRKQPVPTTIQLLVHHATPSPNPSLATTIPPTSARAPPPTTPVSKITIRPRSPLTRIPAPPRTTQVPKIIISTPFPTTTVPKIIISPENPPKASQVPPQTTGVPIPKTIIHPTHPKILSPAPFRNAEVSTITTLQISKPKPTSSPTQPRATEVTKIIIPPKSPSVPIPAPTGTTEVPKAITSPTRQQISSPAPPPIAEVSKLMIPPKSPPISRLVPSPTNAASKITISPINAPKLSPAPPLPTALLKIITPPRSQPTPSPSPFTIPPQKLSPAPSPAAAVLKISIPPRSSITPNPSSSLSSSETTNITTPAPRPTSSSELKGDLPKPPSPKETPIIPIPSPKIKPNKIAHRPTPPPLRRRQPTSSESQTKLPAIKSSESNEKSMAPSRNQSSSLTKNLTTGNSPNEGITLSRKNLTISIRASLPANASNVTGSLVNSRPLVISSKGSALDSHTFKQKSVKIPETRNVSEVIAQPLTQISGTISGASNTNDHEINNWNYDEQWNKDWDNGEDGDAWKTEDGAEEWDNGADGGKWKTEEGAEKWANGEDGDAWKTEKYADYL